MACFETSLWEELQPQENACQLDGGPSRNATGGFELSAWSVERDGSVVIDTDKLIYDYQSKPGGYVFDFVRTNVPDFACQPGFAMASKGELSGAFQRDTVTAHRLESY
jgi:hypothetical protein